jgi:hypothetical protein
LEEKMTNREWNPELTPAETQTRAEFALRLEDDGFPLEEAIEEADRLIAIRRAFARPQTP